MQALIALVARYFFLVIILAEVLFILVFHRRRLLELLLASIFIGGLSLAFAFLLHGIVQDPRPFVVQGSTPLIPSSADNGFPSDHTLLLSATAAITMIANPWVGAVGLLLAVAVGLARVYAGVHHMLDIVGSLFIVGFVTAGYLVTWMLASMGRRKKG